MHVYLSNEGNSKMVVISVTYPATNGSRFDLDYYTTKHLPLLQSLWGDFGLVSTTVLKGIGTPDGRPVVYRMIALLTFESADHFQRAAQQHGKEVMADIKNFTNIKPVVQINEQIG
jgi:uncharacterized protein (TIGR02118 family)